MQGRYFSLEIPESADLYNSIRKNRILWIFYLNYRL